MEGRYHFFTKIHTLFLGILNGINTHNLCQKYLQLLTGTRLLTVMVDIRNLEVLHDDNKQEFFINLGKQAANMRAVLQYERTESNVLNLYHTEVPEELRGYGIAALLAKAAFEYVNQQDLKMQLSCSYLQKYIKDNPLPEHISRVVE